MAQDLSIPPLGQGISVDPFEQTLDRLRRRRERRLPTGFTADGLSYNRGDDIEANLADAWETYKAASRNPQGLWETDEEYKARTQAAPLNLDTELRALGMGGIIPLRSQYRAALSQPVAPAVKVPSTKSEIANWYGQNQLMRDEEYAANQALSQPGADALDILVNQHPMLLQADPYAARYKPIYQAALREREKQDALENAPVDEIAIDIADLARERGSLESALQQKKLPAETKNAYKSRMADIDSLLAPTDAGGESDELVKVWNKNNQPKRIRASDLQRALKLGYRIRQQ